MVLRQYKSLQSRHPSCPSSLILGTTGAYDIEGDVVGSYCILQGVGDAVGMLIELGASVGGVSFTNISSGTSIFSEV